MKMLRLTRFALAAAACFALLGGVWGCSTDSPSEPQQSPGTPPGTAPPPGDFVITLRVSPNTLSAGSGEPATVTVDVRRRDNNQRPAQGTLVTLTTTLGEFGSAGSGQQSGTVALSGGLAQVLLFPGNDAGTAILQASLAGSIGRVTVNIDGAGTFFLSFVQPSTGNPQGGDTVVIQGGGFDTPVRVTFGGAVAQVLSVSPTAITVVTPAANAPVPVGTTLPVAVSVTVNLNEEEEQSDALPSGFTYAPGGGSPTAPVVLGVSPGSGPNEGGTTVTITGQGFVAPVQVLFGQGNSPDTFEGVEAVVQSVTANELVVVTPAATGFGQSNQNATVNILVRNLSNGFATVALSSFKYGTQLLITAFEPGQIVFDSQASVTIFGQGFEEPVAVFISGIAVGPSQGGGILSVTGTEIVVRAPVPFIENCMSVVGPVQVINVETGESDLSGDSNGPTIPDFRFNVFSPVITGVSPSSGPGAGGTGVTISGARFSDPLQVKFGSSAATVNSVTSGSISATTPSFSMFDEESCDDNGDGQQGMRFVPTSVDVEVTNFLTDCNNVLEGGFTYIPSDTTCRGDTAMPPPGTPECQDGLDNDMDGLVDHASINPVNPDPECVGPNDNDESA